MAYSRLVSRDPEWETHEGPLEAKNALYLDLYDSYSYLH